MSGKYTVRLPVTSLGRTRSCSNVSSYLCPWSSLPFVMLNGVEPAMVLDQKVLLACPTWAPSAEFDSWFGFITS